MEILTSQRRGWFVPRTVVLALMLANARLAAQPAAVVEDDVKAAFLYNFAKYIAWPDAAFPTGAFHVCVVADDAFLKRLDDIIAGETIDGRSVMRQTPATPEAARSCHILFVAGGEAARTDQLLVAVKGAHVLTVGDSADFLTRGGVVTFVREGERVRFDVNMTQAQRAGLTISSRLLRVARRVSPPEPRR
jgi:hypothetical protein